MKRKFKLFATVASLCLSVALMAFGVYAAAQVTYSVSGTVSYTANNVLVSVQTTLTPASNANAVYSNVDAVEGASLTWGEATVTGSQKDNYTTLAGTLTSDSGLAVTFGDNKNVWKVEVAVATTQAEKGLTVVAEPAQGAPDTKWGIAAATDNADLSVGPKGNATYTFYIYLINATTGISGATFNIAFTFTQANA